MHTIMSSDVSNIHIYTRRSNVKIKGSQAINNLQMIRVNKRSWNFKRIIICQHFIALPCINNGSKPKRLNFVNTHWTSRGVPKYVMHIFK